VDNYRVIVEHVFPHKYGGVTFLSMFPTRVTFDNKYDLNRALNTFIEDIKKDGGILVEIHRKGDEKFDKLTKKGEFHGMTPAEAAAKMKPWQKKHQDPAQREEWKSDDIQ
jgi:hypothetical protein